MKVNVNGRILSSENPDIIGIWMSQGLKDVEEKPQEVVEEKKTTKKRSKKVEETTNEE